jgi:hypothetical protein
VARDTGRPSGGKLPGLRPPAQSVNGETSIRRKHDVEAPLFPDLIADDAIGGGDADRNLGTATRRSVPVTPLPSALTTASMFRRKSPHPTMLTATKNGACYSF